MPALIVVLGVGALGSHVVQLLRNCDATIRVVDFDRIERKNVASQFHSRTGVGKSKVQSLGQTMQFLFGTKVDAIPHKLVEDNIDKLLSGADLVVECFDNGASRRLVQGYVREHSIPCLHGAVDADGSFGRAIWDESFVIDDEDGAGAATCEDGENLPFIGVVSGVVARTAQVFLTEGKKHGFSISPNGVIRT